MKKRKTKKDKLPPITGNVLECGKKQEQGIFSVWLLKAPEIKAQSASLKAAEELLISGIWDLYELDEPVAIKYQEPLGKDSSSS